MIIKNLIEKLGKQGKIDRKENIKLVEFEKDDDTNWHIENLSSISNLRARNYHIEEVTNFKVRTIAGFYWLLFLSLIFNKK